MDIMDREENVTGVGCITPHVRKEKAFQSNGKIVSLVKGSRVHIGEQVLDVG